MTTQAHAYLCKRVDETAHAHPDSIALVFGDIEISYAQLASQSSDLAAQLAEHALPSTGPVVVALPRGPDQIVAMLAVWRAGMSYLPVDLSDPPRRHDEIRQVTGAVATLSQRPSPSSESTSVAITAHAPTASSLWTGSSQLVRPETAYVIFTSGSTGHPKGVTASHDALSSLLDQLISRYGITGNDRVLQFAAPTFDTSIEQIGVALAAGAALVLPETLWAPSEFHHKITHGGVTVMDLTPSYWREVVKHTNNADLPKGSVRLFILGGAAVSNRDLKAARTVYPHARLLNAYGLTETGITSCLSEIGDTGALDDGPAAVGYPLDGAHLRILDSTGAPVGPEATGNVAVGGRLSLGTMHGTSGLSPLPTVTIGGHRYYLTGDTGHLHPTHGLFVTGRIDRQLKIRGFRVDPEEVEHILRGHESIGDAAVVGDAEATTLHAFYSVAPGHPDPGSQQVLERARATLPAHAVPNTASVMDSLPQTAHGKTDYKALVVDLEMFPSQSGSTSIAIDSAIEHAIACIWTEVVGISRDHLGLSFFDAGGTSIAAAELVARTRSSLGIHVRFVRALIESLLRDPYFSHYCQAVAQARAGLEADSDPRTTMQEDLQRSITLDGPLPRQDPPQLEEASTVLLTGATGFLGSHLLPRLLAKTPAQVVCLVRGESEEVARQRLRTAWETYGSAPDIRPEDHERIDIVLGDLAQPSLGLEATRFEELAARTSLVIHSGGTVNLDPPMRGVSEAAR